MPKKPEKPEKKGLLTAELRNAEQEKENIGHETNFLAGQNTKITFNTWKTRLGSNNVLIIGGTGTGKSRYMVRPNVYSLPVDEKTGKPMSFIFTDPKGELVHDLAGFLEANGYLIKIFNLVNQQFSDCYNPFRSLHTSDDVLIMVDAVVENANGGKSASDPHWTNSAKSILNSIAYYVFYELSAKEQNFTSVSELLNMCGSSEDDDDYKSDYDIALDELAEDPNNQWGEDHPAIQWRRKVQAKGREMSSILSTASTAVRLFASRSIKHLTNVDTMQLDLVGDRPTAVFLVIPTTNSTYNFLISMFYTQLFESLYHRAQTVYADQGGALPHKVVFWMDEFANVGKIPDFDKKIATFRSTGISVCIIVQSPNQIHTLYKEAGTDILDNVHTIVFLGSGGRDGDKSANDWISKALGVKTIQAEQSSVHTKQGDAYSLVSFGSKLTEHSYSATQRPVMTSDEVYRLDPNKCIIMVSGYKPIIDYKIDLDSCLNYGSDLFSDIVGYMPKRDKNGVEIPETEDKTKPIRKLKKAFIYPITGPESRKMTATSYQEGLSHTGEIDAMQQAERLRDMAEEQKYGYGEEVPEDTPEIHDTEEREIINRSNPEKVKISEFHLSVTDHLDEIIAEGPKEPEEYRFDEPDEKKVFENKLESNEKAEEQKESSHDESINEKDETATQKTKEQPSEEATDNVSENAEDNASSLEPDSEVEQSTSEATDNASEVETSESTVEGPEKNQSVEIDSSETSDTSTEDKVESEEAHEGKESDSANDESNEPEAGKNEDTEEESDDSQEDDSDDYERPEMPDPEGLDEDEESDLNDQLSEALSDYLM